MTQEFHLSVTPIRDNDYLVRTEHVAPGVPLAEEQVTWYVDDWLTEASLLMGDPVMGLLRSSGAARQEVYQFSNSRSQEPPANLVAFGQRLFNALFQGTIRDSWMMAQGIAQHQHHRLRFRLGLKGTPLHRLPWEVLYAGDRPLATGTDVIFSRYHSSFSVLKSHLHPPKRSSNDPNQPLKILLVLAAPNDQDGLALKQEAEQLRQELRTVSADNGSQFSAIELTILEQPGREDLTQALEHNHFQVLHYAGHSDLSAAGGSLYLVNQRTGLTEVMSGEDLAGLLVNNGIRMAVFNSCRGVYTATSASGQASEGNLAESLVRRGIPAVLAMAERIPDNVALNLSRLFYRNLKQAYPLDLSLSRTRQGLISSYGSDQLYWALPILYLHPEFDGFLQPPTTQPSGFGQSSFATSYTDFYASSDLLSFAVEEPVSTGGRSRAEWQPEYPDLESNSRSRQEENLPDFDELEFDDPDPPEEEQVARLVHELSHSPTLLEPEEPVLSAPLEENLLPNRSANGKLPYLQLETPVRSSASAPANSTVIQPSIQPPEATSAKTTPQPGNASSETRVYSELAAVLADMGTLTEAIASGNRAVQENPNSAEAYTNLGWALYQQGYLTEAISAYNQAIRLNPAYANAFNRLGLAFFQQGKIDDAVRAYSQAVKLDPTLTEASTNLRNALYDQDNSPSIATPPPSSPAQPTAKPRQPRYKNRVWVWGSLGAISLAALIAGWFYREELTKRFAPPANVPGASLPASPASNDPLSNLDSKTLTNRALQQLRQDDSAAAQATIEALLNQPNRLKEADQVLQAVPSKFVDQPGMAFLRGRLIWQRWVAGEKSAKVEAARSLWDKSIQAQPTPMKYNAIGFAYYAEGKPDRAEQTWMAALRAGGTVADRAPENSSLNSDTLTTYAGLALSAWKLAEQQPVNQQNALREEAIKRREIALQGDRAAFRPEALRQNWMWSETAIRDWEALLKL
ncbi:MAG: CHAT domain-containing protein [Leptolyngbyaceae cyanobacterium bins.302]|nr:CHAT domain-containing protein [Leptolyngbyaceae cyanobacterium bins.302]